MSSPPNTSDSEECIPATLPRRESIKFCAGDADVIFVSSDNVLFHIHRKNLEANAAAFPQAEFDTHGEDVPLTEDSATLELLFQFIYPQRHPDLKDIPFSTLAPVAEAAEKYEVFAAMNICKIRMVEQASLKHSVRIADYAQKHGYPDLLDVVSPFLLDIPLDNVVVSLSAEMAIPWVLYRERWSRVLYKAIHFPQTLTSCPTCKTRLPVSENSRLWASLREKRSRTALEGLLTGAEIPCVHVDEKTLGARLDQYLLQVPSFNSFLSRAAPGA